MKKGLFFSLALVSACFLASCGGTNDNSNTSTVVPPTISDISTIRTAELNTAVAIKGIVVKHVYTGQTTPYITGMMVADTSGCVYVYGETVAKSTTVGNEVTLTGNKDYYIPNTDTGAAPAVNYKGALQLVDPVILHNDEGNHPIPDIITPLDSLKDVMSIPLSTDITNNLYSLNGRVRRVAGADYNNYYFDDLNRTDSIGFYTQSNGKDYAWLDTYLGQTINLTFAIQNAKPGVGLWRGMPVIYNSAVTVTDKQEADYALERAIAPIRPTYGDATTFEITADDALLEGVIRDYTCADTNVTITKNENVFTFALADVEETTNVTIKVKVTYNDEVSTRDIMVKLGYKPTYTATPIAEARLLETDAVVTIEGIVGRRTYKSGTSASPLGCFIVDDTGSMIIYNNANFMDSLKDVVEGNLIAVRGTIQRYKSNQDNAAANNYEGDLQLADVELIYCDGGQNALPDAAIQNSTVAAIKAMAPSTNITGMIYRVSGKVVKGTNSYNIIDPTNADISLNVYSQKSGSDFKWLLPYDGQVVTLYLGVQNAKYTADNFNWRVCPISVIPAAA